MFANMEDADIEGEEIYELLNIIEFKNLVLVQTDPHLPLETVGHLITEGSLFKSNINNRYLRLFVHAAVNAVGGF